MPDFDPFASGAAVAEPPAPKRDWTNLFSGLEGVDNRVPPEHREVLKQLDAVSENPKEARAQAINQSYIQTEHPEIPAGSVQNDWPAVRTAYARDRYGMTDEDVSDEKLYGLIGADLEQKQDQSLKDAWATSGPLERLKMMFGSKGFGQTEVEGAVPAIGSEAGQTKGGLFTIPKMEGKSSFVGLINAANKMTSSLTSPENVGIGVLTAGAGSLAQLANSVRMAVVARATQAAALGTFTAIGAKDSVHAIAEAKKAIADPKASDAEKSEAIATAVFSTAMTAAAAKGTFDFGKAAVGEEAKGASDAVKQEQVKILREEAAKADKKTAKVLNEVADSLEPGKETVVEEPKPAETPKAETPKEQPRSAQVEELDNGGYVVTNEKGELVDYAQTPEEAQAISEGYTAGKVQEPTQVQPAGEPPVKAAKQAVVGIKNASIDEAFEKMGMEPPEHGERTSFEQARADAAAKMEADPRAGENLVRSLEENPRPVTGKENALLLHELTRLTNERAAAEKAFIEATKMGDTVEIESAKARVAQAQADYVRVAEVDTRVGTANAVGLALRRMMMAEDYSLAAMERRRMVANEGKPLTEEQSAEVKELHERIAATQKAFDDYVAKHNKVIPFPKTKVAEKLSQRAQEARARIGERLRKAASAGFVEGENVGELFSKENLNDLAVVGAEYIAKGVKELGAWSDAMVKEFGEKIRPYLQDIFNKASEVKTEEQRLEAKKARLEKSTEKLKEKIAAGDTSKPERKPIHLDEEANRLQAEHDMAKLEFDRMVEQDRYEKLSPIRKAGENALAAWDSTRAILAGFEFSAVARQGALRLFSHPVETVKSMGDAFKALVATEEGAHAINLKTLNDPEAASAKANKLALIDEKASLNKQEEIYMGKLVGKIPGVKNFERFAHVFLNKVRLDMWKEMRSDFPEANQRLIADFINAATGRGSMGRLEASAVVLNRVLFSPRFLMSRIQMGSGYHVWKAAIAGDGAAVKAVSQQYAKSMIGYATFLSALYYGVQAYTDEKVSISTDPRSSEFMKLKVGNTRIDLAAGIQQPLVFLSRMATKEKTLSSGKTVSIKKDAGSEALRFGRSKLNPSASKGVDFYTGTNMVGEPATVTDLLYPATYADIVDAFKAHDIPEALGISLLAMFGVGIQTYDANKKRPKVVDKSHETP